MYKKGVAVEIQFSAERLNDNAGDPYWIDLTRDEAQSLLQTLQTQLAPESDAKTDAHQGSASVAAPIVVSLDPSADGDKAGYKSGGNAAATEETAAPEFTQWVCLICGWIYDEAAGLPEEGIAPGTRWADVPDDWRCPLCDVGKEDFALVEF